MKSARPTEAKTSALEPRPDFITARLQAGEVVGALDYPESDRPQFWASIAIVRDACQPDRSGRDLHGANLRREVAAMSRPPSGWLAQNIPTCSGTEKHEAISELLTKILNRLRGSAA